MLHGLVRGLWMRMAANFPALRLPSQRVWMALVPRGTPGAERGKRGDPSAWGAPVLSQVGSLAVGAVCRVLS